MSNESDETVEVTETTTTEVPAHEVKREEKRVDGEPEGEVVEETTTTRRPADQ